MSQINASVSGASPITASVGETQIDVAAGSTAATVDVAVSGGFGPTGSSGVVTVSAPVTNSGTSSAANIGLAVGAGLSTGGGALVVSYGTTAGTACQGNDARLSDARTPLSHTHTASQITDFTTAVIAAAPPTTNASLLTSGTLSADRLPLAAANTRGAVRIGSGISIDGDGVISASSGYTLPTATDSVLGGVKIGAGVTITDGVISVSTSYAATTHTHALSSLTQSSATTGQVVTWSGSAWTAANIDGGIAGVLASLLLHFDGANNSTTFTDSSSNNYSVTRGGSATISTAQSKFGGASLALDGDGDYVSTTAPIELGSGDFTIEAWVFVDSESSGTRPIASAYDLAPTPTPFAKWLFYVDGDGTLSFLAENAAQGQWTLQCIGAEVQTDEWVHVAVTRSNGSLHLFVDGVEDTNSVSNADLNIPSADITAVGKLVENGAGAAHFAGYIDEFRIVQGEAIFTGNYTPATAPYSDASVAGTTILQRRGTAANLAGVTLGAGQIAYETDTGKIKVGNGSTVYTSLAYVGGSSAWADITGKPETFAPSSHTHGNVSNDGLVNGNTASGQIVVTTTGGALTTASSIASSAVSGLGGAATLNVGTTAGTVAAGDHTHTQLHDRSHAITSSSDHTATAWRVFHSDASGQIVELALGAAGTVLTSGGASAAPTWAAGGGAVRSDTVSNVSYIGRALSGSATSASVWTIRRTTVASAGTVTTATAANVKWDDRLTASYS
jgi:hypothetical protein